MRLQSKPVADGVGVALGVARMRASTTCRGLVWCGPGAYEWMDGKVRVGPAQAVPVGGPVRHRVGTGTWGWSCVACGRVWPLRAGFSISGGGIRGKEASEELGFAEVSHCLDRRTDL
jgi:hypothetical protein